MNESNRQCGPDNWILMRPFAVSPVSNVKQFRLLRPTFTNTQSAPPVALALPQGTPLPPPAPPCPQPATASQPSSKNPPPSLPPGFWFPPPPAPPNDTQTPAQPSVPLVPGQLPPTLHPHFQANPLARQPPTPPKAPAQQLPAASTDVEYTDAEWKEWYYKMD